MTGNVLLLGMKHCGKSRLGRLLAERLRADFIDVDDLILRQDRQRGGGDLTVREIFSRDGEEEFGRLEAETVRLLAHELETTERPAVIALGGRTPLNPAALPVLRALGRMVFLDVDPEIVWQRVQRKGLPPFIGDSDPRGDFMALFAVRRPGYQAAAHTTVALDGEQSVDDNVERIMAALGEDHAR